MVGPIDLQNVIAKAGKVERYQHTNQNQQSANLEAFVDETSAKASLKESQVQQSPKSEQSELGDKEQREQQRSKQEANKTEDENRSEEVVIPEPDRGHNIDIKA